MSQTGAPQNKNPMQYVFNARMAGVGAQVGCLTLLIVLVAVFGGIWLDRVLNTKPVFTIMLVLGSAPLSLVLTFWVAMRAVKNTPVEKDLTPRIPGAAQPQPEKEEDTGE